MSITLRITVSDFPSEGAFQRAVEDGVTELIDEADKDFSIITKHDDNPADFEKAGRGLDQEIKTDDEYFTRRNNGRPATVITPTSKKFLRFRSQYDGRTTPGAITSRAGQGKHGDYVFAKQVNHPGHPPYAHDIAVAEHLESDLAEKIICKHIEKLFN